MPSPTLTFVALGLIILAVAWLPLVLDRIPLSLPMVAVAFGALLFGWLRHKTSITDYRELAEALTEVVLIVAVMGAGLKIDRPFSLSTWTSTWRLLGIVMPLSILAIALCAAWLIGLPAGLAVLLGGILAPTDAVLASGVQVGPPGTGEEGEVRFALTSEAGLNDGLAFPFVILGMLIVERGPDPGAWLTEWIFVDVIWKIAAAVAIGAAIGWALVFVNRGLPKPFRLARSRDGLVALGITFLVYGVADLCRSYGFVAVFMAAVTLRNTSLALDYHRQLSSFAEQVERLAMVLVLVLFGGALAQGQLSGVTWQDAVFTVLVLLAIRPAASAVGFLGSPQSRPDRIAIGYFGIRGLGSLYYVVYATNHIGAAETDRLWTVVSLVVLVSIVLYGTTSDPVMHRLGLKGKSRRGDERQALAHPLREGEGGPEGAG